MKNRVITSVAILAAMLTVVIFSEFIVYPLALALLAVIATFEVLRVIGAHKIFALSIPAYLISVAFPLTTYFVDSNNSLEFLLILAAVVFVYLVWLMGVSVF